MVSLSRRAGRLWWRRHPRLQSTRAAPVHSGFLPPSWTVTAASSACLAWALPLQPFLHWTISGLYRATSERRAVLLSRHSHALRARHQTPRCPAGPAPPRLTPGSPGPSLRPGSAPSASTAHFRQAPVLSRRRAPCPSLSVTGSCVLTRALTCAQTMRLQTCHTLQHHPGPEGLLFTWVRPTDLYSTRNQNRSWLNSCLLIHLNQ